MISAINRCFILVIDVVTKIHQARFLVGRSAMDSTCTTLRNSIVSPTTALSVIQCTVKCHKCERIALSHSHANESLCRQVSRINLHCSSVHLLDAIELQCSLAQMVNHCAWS